SSGGLSRKMETTAVAALAWVKSPRHVSRAQQAAGWLTSHRQGTAGFGSTQATVLALKALIAVASESSSTVGGTIQVKLDGEIIGHAKLPDDPRSGTAVEVEGLGAEIEELLRDRIEIELELVAMGSNGLAYTVDIACHVETPESDEACPLRLTTELASDRVAGPVTDGQLLTVHASLANVSARGLPMTVAIVGLPGGVEPRVDELDELQDASAFDYYEIRGRDIVFYWRTIAPEQTLDLEFHATAAIPGIYTGPASRTYLYYTAEQKQWVEPLQVEIEP
ncbi:MAG: hypothetical protein ACR2NZ_15640, partial [Rubripirellula sp.]